MGGWGDFHNPVGNEEIETIVMPVYYRGIITGRQFMSTNLCIIGTLDRAASLC